jgi:DNA-binding response OmpR family regulator
MSSILVVEDERELANLIKRQLESAGYLVQVALDGRAALHVATDRGLRPPDLVILDWMLPGLDGLTICRRLRAQSAIPILMLTARADEADRVLGLEVGADDYLTKPFSMRELLARVGAILRRVELMRPAPPDSAPLRYGDLTLDPEARYVTMGGNPVDLTVKEYELLSLLLRHPGRTFSRAYLLEHVWSADYEGGDRTVDMHMVRLRKKLGPLGDSIATVWGVGYRLQSGIGA